MPPDGAFLFLSDGVGLGFGFEGRDVDLVIPPLGFQALDLAFPEEGIDDAAGGFTPQTTSARSPSPPPRLSPELMPAEVSDQAQRSEKLWFCRRKSS